MYSKTMKRNYLLFSFQLHWRHFDEKNWFEKKLMRINFSKQNKQMILAQTLRAARSRSELSTGRSKSSWIFIWAEKRPFEVLCQIAFKSMRICEIVFKSMNNFQIVFKSMQIYQNSVQIHEHLPNNIQIHENLWNSVQIHENLPK